MHRLVFGADITSAFGIAPSRNTMSMVVFAVQSVALLLLWRAARAPRRAASFATS